MTKESVAAPGPRPRLHLPIWTILVVSVIAALLIALPTGRKISRIAAAAKSLGTLDIDQVTPLPDGTPRGS